MRRRFLLVHNPIAGLQRQDLVQEARTGLEHLGAEIIAHQGGPEMLSEGLRQHAPSLDAVICAGGDGTVRHLACALEPYGLPLGIIPVGTGNVLSHEIGLPETAVGLANLLLHGSVREFQGARANGEPFFLMAGVGFDGEVIHRLNTSLKRKFGKAAYVQPILQTLRKAQPLLQVEVDGSKHSARWVVVTNARRYGGSFIIADDAGINRPGLVAVLMKNSGNFGLLRQLLALGAGALNRVPGVEVIPCRHVTVQSESPVATQIDGDAFVTTPLTISSGGASIRLIVPQKYEASLDR